VTPNQVSCNEFLDWININDLLCLLLDLVILGVMEGKGCIEFIKDRIGLYVMECVWMNEILVLIRFLILLGTLLISIGLGLFS